MVLEQLVFDENRYTRLFHKQHGFGMPKYRGSPQTGGSFWGRVVGFAKGLFSKAAPMLSNFITTAQPHVKGMATKAVESVIDKAVEKVNEKLKQTQQGKGIKRRKKQKGKKKSKSTLKKKAKGISSTHRKKKRKHVAKRHRAIDAITDKF